MSCMKDKIFIDTNVLIYLYSKSEPAKQRIATQIILERETLLCISSQVLGEFTNILYKKYHYGIEIIEEALKDFKNRFSIGAIGTETVERALGIMKR